MEYLRYKPMGFWTLSDIAAANEIPDSSGYYTSSQATQVRATPTGTNSVTHGISVSSSAVHSVSIDDSAYLSFPSAVYRRTKERAPFSLAASVRRHEGVGLETLTNLLENPSVEVNTNHWTAITGSGAATTGAATVNPVYGLKHFRVTWTTAPAAGTGGIKYENITVENPGRTHFFTGYFRSSASRSAHLTARFYNSSGTEISNIVGSDTSVSTTLTRRTLSFMVPANTATMSMELTPAAGAVWPVGGTLDADAFLLVEAGLPTTLTYFDGDSLNAEWEGEPHASRSIKTMAKSEVRVLGNLDQMDGITMTDDHIYFTTMYTNTGIARCAYHYSHAQKFDIVAVHTEKKNSLYVNGELVDEVDISLEQQNDTYLSDAEFLMMGPSEVQMPVYGNAVAIYPHALKHEDIKQMYVKNNEHPVADIAKSMGGESIYFSTRDRQPYIDMAWVEDDDWQAAEHSGNLSIRDNAVEAVVTDGITSEGFWEDTFSIEKDGALIPVSQVIATWEGKNVKVELGHGDVWTEVQQGRHPEDIFEDLAAIPEDDEIEVRVTFFGDRPEAFIKNLHIKAYTGSTYVSGGKTIELDDIGADSSTLTKTREEFAPYLMHELWGALCQGTGSDTRMLIGPDVSDTPQQIRSVEIWFKRTDVSSHPYRSTIPATASPTLYRNPAALPDVNGWSHVVVLLEAPVDRVILGQDGYQIGKVAVFTEALTQAQANKLYESQIRTPSITITNGGSVILTEPSDSVDIYDTDLAISSA